MLSPSFEDQLLILVDYSTMTIFKNTENCAFDWFLPAFPKTFTIIEIIHFDIDGALRWQ